MKVGGGNKIVEKIKSRRGVAKNKERRNVEYLVIGYKVTATFIVIFGMCRREGYTLLEILGFATIFCN